MLTIVVPGQELFNPETSEFIYVKETTLQLEHSLVSLNKWESKWHEAFLSNKQKTSEQLIDYIKCMTLNHNVDQSVYLRLTADNIAAIKEYIDAPMTATQFPNDKPSTSNKETVTAELIYYWMIVSNIPFECQKWHLNKLLTLIKVCSVKNTPPKKMTKNEIINRNRSINAARRSSLGTRG